MEENFYGADYLDYYFGLGLAGEFAGLAVQHRLGILPERWARTSPADSHCLCLIESAIRGVT